MHPLLAIPLTLLFQTTLTPTAYDDGRACPAGCDAHVVVHPRHNGSALVRLPSNSASHPLPCASGARCLICFSTDSANCVETTYRGSGPPPGRADFTPAFYRAACGDSLLAPSLRATCRAANRAVQALGRRRNCFRESSAQECNKLMADARTRKASDDSLYRECRSKGEQVFNRDHRDSPRLQRSLGCAYERFGTGRNQAGTVTWRRLLDGACRPDTFAGRDGLDCCSDDLWAAALFRRECARFFPEPRSPGTAGPSPASRRADPGG
jgi:hypothetical protein